MTIEATEVSLGSPDPDAQVLHRMNFVAGNKSLWLAIHVDFSATTRVENIVNLPSQKGSTTQVYAEAKIKLEQAAELYRRPISYSLSTPFESMKRWALGPGLELFRWDQVYEIAGRKLIAIKRFEPSTA